MRRFTFLTFIFFAVVAIYFRQKYWPEHNEVLNDYLRQNTSAWQSIKQGNFPFWTDWRDPATNGYPVYSTGQLEIFEPFNVFWFTFSPPLTAGKYLSISYYFLAGFTMYRLIFYFTSNHQSSLLVGFIYELSLLKLAYLGQLAYLPLLFLLAAKAVKRQDYLFAVIAGLVLAVMAQSLSIVNILEVVICLLIFYLLSIFFLYKNRLQSLIWTAKCFLTTISFALGLMAIILLPRMEFNSFAAQRDINNQKIRLSLAGFGDAWLVSSYKVAPSAQGALDYLTSPEFNPKQEVILEEDVNFKPYFSPEIIPVVVKTISPTLKQVRLSLKEPKILILKDSFYPAWQANLDDRPTRVYRGNYLFQAVIVPAGEHRINFEYFLLSFYIGLTISLIFLVSLLSWTYYHYAFSHKAMAEPLVKIV